MTLSDSSWQNIEFLPFHNPFIHLISPLPTFLFPKLNVTLNGRRFQTAEDITNATNDLKAKPQTSLETDSKLEKAVGEVHCWWFEGDNIP
jgi:hypothetical protein